MGGIKTVITDGGGEAQTVRVRKNPRGLMTYTHPYENRVSALKFFFNPTYGLDMNQAATFSGTPDKIHNGTDNVLWTGSAISGTWTFDTTDQAQQGTKSVDGTASVKNDEALFTRGSTISSDNYTAMTGYIYLTGWPTTGTKNVQIYNRLAGVVVGDVLDITSYIDPTFLNVWQKFSIDIADFNMGSTNIDEFVVRTISDGAGVPPDYYLDTMQWEQVGAPINFDLQLNAGKVYWQTNLHLSFVAPFVSTLANSSHQNLPYDTMLGQTISNGIVFLFTSVAADTINVVKTHMDIAQLATVHVESGGDGTNTWVTYNINFSVPVEMRGDVNDRFRIIISDDLSPFLHFRVFSTGYEVDIPLNR